MVFCLRLYEKVNGIHSACIETVPAKELKRKSWPGLYLAIVQGSSQQKMGSPANRGLATGFGGSFAGGDLQLRAYNAGQVLHLLCVLTG